MANDLARAAAIQQAINSPGYYEILNIGDTMVSQLKDDLVNAEEGFESAHREARGAVRFWNKFKSTVANAANTQIEAETEIALV